MVRYSAYSLNGCNEFEANNTWAVSLIRYGAIVWTADDLNRLDIMIISLLSRYEMLHQNVWHQELHVSKKRDRTRIELEYSIREGEINIA